MRAGLLSQPEVIQEINERFVSTTITCFEVMELAKKGDELARKVAPNWSYPVSLMFLTPEGQFVTLLNPMEELTDAHPDTDPRPGQRHDWSPERNTQIFLDRVRKYFGQTP